MFSINHVVISGNLTRDPETKATQGGTEICRLGIAHNKRVKRGDTWEDVPQFFDCVLFGSMAQQAAKLRKGQKIVVSGELSYSTWQAQDGSKRSKVEIAVRDFVDCSAPSKAVAQPDLYDEDIPFN